jgi:2-polyprenyl-3-methyl-5-hydroxy-6-metoxy-1,4-benzoquinol methylase
VRTMKRVGNLAPSTIRHRHGALARCFDWMIRKHPEIMAQNPLRLLKRGFATYTDADAQHLAAQGRQPKHNVERDRRLHEDEETRIMQDGGAVTNEFEQGGHMATPNAQQEAEWNGRSGECWVANQARLDAMVAAFGQAAIAAAAPAAGERVLDVGCGAGASSLALAALVGTNGQVLGVDIYRNR